MSTGTKTDNHSPGAKLLLRRHFLEKYHAAKPPRVLDCFQGSSLLWLRLGREFERGDEPAFRPREEEEAGAAGSIPTARRPEAESWQEPQAVIISSTRPSMTSWTSNCGLRWVCFAP